MDKKAMSHVMYIVISLVVMLIVAVIVITIAQQGITGGGDKLIDVIKGTKIPEVGP